MLKLQGTHPLTHPSTHPPIHPQHLLREVEADEGAPPDGLVDRSADQEGHLGGEVQPVREVPRQEHGAEDAERPPVEADGHHEGDEQEVHELAELVRELGVFGGQQAGRQKQVGRGPDTSEGGTEASNTRFKKRVGRMSVFSAFPWNGGECVHEGRTQENTGIRTVHGAVLRGTKKQELERRHSFLGPRENTHGDLKIEAQPSEELNA